MKCHKCGSEMKTISWFGLFKHLECSKCGHEEKVGAKSSSLEHSKNIALGYPTDAQMDEAVRRTKEKVGGCSDCERQPIPDCEKCEKVGGEKR